MKSAEIEIIFTLEDVQQFVQTLGDQNPIYQSINQAKAYGYPSIPLPPTMPSIAYKWMEIPWEFLQPLIHRKQECFCYETMYIDYPYQAVVSIDHLEHRDGQVHIQQSLHLYNEQMVLCYKGTSYLLAGGIK